jgi:hypothetical protein
LCEVTRDHLPRIGALLGIGASLARQGNALCRSDRDFRQASSQSEIEP